MSLGVVRLFLASILAKNTTIWPQLQGATSPTSLDTSLGLPEAWAQGDRLSNLSRSSGPWARCVCTPASALGLGVRGAVAGSRPFPGGVRGSALGPGAGASARRGETGAVGEAVPGAPSSLNGALQRWNLKGQPGGRWCRSQPADTGLAGQAPERWFRRTPHQKTVVQRFSQACSWVGPRPLVMPGT